mmetsp:Transcript_25450/g.40799  ORF Transcript_25450/g.40799 Transcript_25450/m.40799 type:complete len:154 (+) Transcript_25450:1110-1571(+)
MTPVLAVDTNEGITQEGLKTILSHLHIEMDRGEEMEATIGLEVDRLLSANYHTGEIEEQPFEKAGSRFGPALVQAVVGWLEACHKRVVRHCGQDRKHRYANTVETEETDREVEIQGQSIISRKLKNSEESYWYCMSYFVAACSLCLLHLDSRE